MARRLRGLQFNQAQQRWKNDCWGVFVVMPRDEVVLKSPGVILRAFL